MSASQAKYDAAEALYKAITEQVEKADRFGSPAEVLEQLAHAYALVAQNPARNPDEKGTRGPFA